MHRLSDPFDSPQRLSQSVVQAGEMLGLYRAEVARVLGFHCKDISALFDGRLLLVPGSDAATQGERFVRLYQALYDLMQGDGPRMVHWLRGDNPELGNSPFLLMIDEGRLDQVVTVVENLVREGIGEGRDQLP